MNISGLTIALFMLNLFDAFLTIYWVRNGYASEGNIIMAGLLDMGNTPFLAVKLGMGAIAAAVLLRWKNLRIAQYGLGLALIIYTGVMAVHFLTGLSAFGYLSEATINNYAEWTNKFFAAVV